MNKPKSIDVTATRPETQSKNVGVNNHGMQWKIVIEASPWERDVKHDINTLNSPEMKHNSKNVTTRNPWTSYDALDDVPRVIGWKGELSH